MRLLLDIRLPSITIAPLPSASPQISAATFCSVAAGSGIQDANCATRRVSIPVFVFAIRRRADCRRRAIPLQTADWVTVLGCAGFFKHRWLVNRVESTLTLGSSPVHDTVWPKARLQSILFGVSCVGKTGGQRHSNRWGARGGKSGNCRHRIRCRPLHALPQDDT